MYNLVMFAGTTKTLLYDVPITCSCPVDLWMVCVQPKHQPPKDVMNKNQERKKPENRCWFNV